MTHDQKKKNQSVVSTDRVVTQVNRLSSGTLSIMGFRFLSTQLHTILDFLCNFHVYLLHLFNYGISRFFLVILKLSVSLT